MAHTSFLQMRIRCLRKCLFHFVQVELYTKPANGRELHCFHCFTPTKRVKPRMYFYALKATTTATHRRRTCAMPTPPIEVGSTNDTVTGTAGNDTLDDTFFGTEVYGGLGDDLIRAHTDDFNRPDLFHGGGGIDTVTYAAVTSGVFADLGFGWAYRLNAAGDVPLDGSGQPLARVRDDLVQIENITGSNSRDTLFGNGLANTLRGEGGNDQIDGRGGDDSLDGGAGNDTVVGGAGNDTVAGGTGDDSLRGGDGNDSMNGGSGFDTLRGEAGHDTLIGGGGGDESLDGGDGNDLLVGGGGMDTLLGGSGNDTINAGGGNDLGEGGAGIDLLLFTTASAVTVNLVTGRTGGLTGVDTISGFENVTTGTGADWVRGSVVANFLITDAGNDTVFAGGGNDRVISGPGDDRIAGEAGNDTLSAGSGNDRLDGGTGNDSLAGHEGNDTMNGGSGDDTIWGGSGNDLIRGGAGADQLYGSTGADVFRWQAGDFGMDIIHDFQLGLDKFSFGSGFFAVEPVGATDLSDVMYAFLAPGGGATLMAHTTAGWQAIARLNGVDPTALGNAIADESILAVGVAPVGDGPGGLLG
jgi:Ca2+-binding RTX toxin-like protein